MLSIKKRNAVLKDMAAGLLDFKEGILKANKQDMSQAASHQERLLLTESRIIDMSRGLGDLIALDDPLNNVLDERITRQGLHIKKISVPIGTVLMIYEARPNVTIDAAGICLKSGNRVFLKGGSEALHTNALLYHVIQNALQKNNVDSSFVMLVRDREEAKSLLLRDDLIDVVIPRGGKALIKEVVDNSRIPVLKHYEGICTIYVDEHADLKMAEEIIVNAKVSRPGVCNAVENVIVHDSIAPAFLPLLKAALPSVELRGCENAASLIDVRPATEEDYRTEYLGLILSVKVVAGLDEAIEFIHQYGSGHSESIITEGHEAARRFLAEVDSAAVYHNASTRFTDGACFEMGAEMGISTQKLHARGPVGLKEMTSYKHVISGNGQVRK